MDTDKSESPLALRDAIAQESHSCQLCKVPVPNGTEIRIHIAPISKEQFEREIRGKSLSKKSLPGG